MDADPPPLCIASSVPKSVVLPADAIVIYSITVLELCLAPNTPLVEEAQEARPCLAIVRSPKSVALPAVSIKTNSITSIT